MTIDEVLNNLKNKHFHSFDASSSKKVVSNNFQEEDDVYSSSLVPFKISSSHRYKNKNYKNTILDIIYEIKNTDDGGSDNDNKGSQT